MIMQNCTEIQITKLARKVMISNFWSIMFLWNRLEVIHEWGTAIHRLSSMHFPKLVIMVDRGAHAHTTHSFASIDLGAVRRNNVACCYIQIGKTKNQFQNTSKFTSRKLGFTACRHRTTKNM